MAELLRNLQDSRLVARFQRRCGLFPAPDEGPREKGAARPPGAEHLSAAHGPGGGAPANGLQRVAAPQVTARPVLAGLGEGAARRASGPAGRGDSASGGCERRACWPGRAAARLPARWAEGRGLGI